MVTTIILNGRATMVEGEEVSYADIVRLAFPAAPTNAQLTVVYRRGAPPSDEGELIHDMRVRVVPWMVFMVGDISKA